MSIPIAMEKLLTTIIQLKASDLHITVGQPPVVRHQGRMRKLETASLTGDDTAMLMKSITPDACQQEIQQRGGADFAIEYTDGVRFRVAVFKQRGNIGLVLRRIPSEFLTFEILRMPEAIRSLIVRPRGLLLVTGPTGSGKTTTLYSALNELNDLETKIITTEDPVEYEIDGIVQCQVQSEIGLTFASALRAILRQDPDVILVGEIRDLETAQIAIQASLTGHLVFSTLHTNDAASAVTRLRDMGVEPFLITATVEAIQAQRLVRKVCQACKIAYDPTDDQLMELNLKREHLKGQFYYGEGCSKCNNLGFKGRTGLYELIMMNDDIRDIISKGGSTDQLRNYVRKQGIMSLRDCGIQGLYEATTTLEEVARETVMEDDL